MSMTALLACAMMLCLPMGCTVGEQGPGEKEQAPVSAAPTAEGDLEEGKTIEYIVYLKPQDQRDTDAPELYQNFDRAAFADSIMNAVYYHRARVTDMQTGEVLTIDDIKTREVEDPNYARDKMAGVRFTEEWTFDPTNLTMTKRVRRMLIGYEVVVDSVIEALRPGFEIELAD